MSIDEPRALGTQSPAQPGRFSFNARTDHWEWDEEVYRIHGITPGSITPSTQVILNHAGGLEELEKSLVHASRTGEPFALPYTLNAADDVDRHVVMIVDPGICDDDGYALIEGHLVDLTADLEVESSAIARRAVSASAKHRESIEQAKGALMLAYGLSPDQAFAMIQWWSRNRNIKVRDLAARLVDLVSNEEISDTTVRTHMDALLHDIADDEP